MCPAEEKGAMDIHMKSYFDIGEISHWRYSNIGTGTQRGCEISIYGDNQNATEQGPLKPDVTFEVVSNLVSDPAFSGVFGPNDLQRSLPT